MQLFVLYLKANLENIAQVSLPEGYEYCIDVTNSAGEDTRKGVRVTSLHTEELKDSRGTANFTVKWVKDAKKAAYLTVVPVKGLTRHITAEDDNAWVPLIGFDCRGLDVTGFHPEDGFVIKSKSGATFADVDLSQGEWVEYDEKLGDSVGIYDLEHKLEPHH